jgi:mono/diheme cytochrome c family protein
MPKWLKRIGYGVGGLAVVVVVTGATIYTMSESRFRRTYVVAPETLAPASDSAALARGEHLASAVAGCGGCHGPGLRGGAMFDAAPMGRLVALNLTSGDGGVGATLTPEIIERAVRHGVGHDGRALRIMPSDGFQYLSDDDTGR